MNCLPLLSVIFCILSVAGFGESVESPAPTPPPHDTGIQPQVGDWPVITTGWTDDECNAAEGLSVPTSVTIPPLCEDRRSAQRPEAAAADAGTRARAQHQRVERRAGCVRQGGGRGGGQRAA